MKRKAKYNENMKKRNSNTEEGKWRSLKKCVKAENGNLIIRENLWEEEEKYVYSNHSYSYMYSISNVLEEKKRKWEKKWRRERSWYIIINIEEMARREEKLTIQSEMKK